jgi:hypothetical protein
VSNLILTSIISCFLNETYTFFLNFFLQESFTNVTDLPANSTLLDYNGALKGLLLLQDTYEFKVESAVLLGQINYLDSSGQSRVIHGGEKLVKEDLMQLTKLAEKEKYYDRAIEFLKTATR